MVRVRTASGSLQSFNPRKIHRTCVRAGASPELARAAVEEVRTHLYEGMSTEKILQIVLDYLEEHQAADVASKYDLKSAIMRMGPAGFAFETFLSQVLGEYGYQTQLRQKVRGRCVEHEIDIILLAHGVRSMVEVKYHNASGIYTGLKEAMYTYARFLDLREGHQDGTCERFDEAWLASNTRSSREARAYAACKGIRLLGWRYPPARGLERMIEDKYLYPVTVLRSMDSDALKALSRANMMLTKDLISKEPKEIAKDTGLPQDRVDTLVEQARHLAAHSPQAYRS